MEAANDPIVVDNYSFASPIQRILAFAIDYAVAGLFMLIPVFGFSLSYFYLLFKDGIHIGTKRSIGKKIIGIRVVQGEKNKINMLSSLKRNIFFLPNFLLIIYGFEFYYVVLLLNGIAALIETYQMYVSDEGERLGDHFAGTNVVEDLHLQ